jgi:hypothetical protein
MPFRHICICLFVTLFSVGCSTKKIRIESFNEGYATATSECASTLKLIEQDLQQKNQVLRKFNQVNESGELYAPKTQK